MKKTIGLIRIALFTSLLVAASAGLYAASSSSLLGVSTGVGVGIGVVGGEHACESGTSYKGVLGQSHTCTTTLGTYTTTIGRK